MKKAIFSCAILTSFSLVSFAQNTQTNASMSMQAPNPGTPVNAAPNPRMAPGPNQRMAPAQMIAERRCKMYQQQLGLTDVQYKGILEAERTFWEQDMAARTSGGQPGPGQSMQNQMAKDQKFKQVLTAEQYTKYEASTHPKPMAPPSAPTTK